MALALIVARLLLAAVFVVARLTKLTDLAGSQQVGTRRSPSSGIRAMAFASTCMKEEFGGENQSAISEI